jgi:uncharacterized protein
MARFNILALSGGGYFGLYTISVLAELERAFGPIGRHVDLLAGTSVGGIIALGLAAEIPASEIKEAFEQNGTRIFSARPAPTAGPGSFRDLLRFAFKPKYQTSGLHKTIVQILGEELLIMSLKHPIIVPVVNLTKGRPQLFKTPHHASFRTDLHLRVVDVAIAATAAPSYFPIAEIGDALYVDGGLYANSPDLLAVHEAEHFFEHPFDEIHLLSVGTTTSRFSFAHAQGRKFGSVDWLRDQRLVSVIIASQQLSVDSMMEHRLRKRYRRLDIEQSKEQEKYLALDVATVEAQKTIRGLAAATVQSHVGDPWVKEFFAHVAPPPKFFHS